MPDTPKPPRIVQAKEYRTTFANGMRVRIGDNDGGITFLIEAPDDAGVLFHEDQVQVVMTPKTMKILHITLGYAVSELERMVGGTIPVTPEQMSAIQSQTSKKT